MKSIETGWLKGRTAKLDAGAIRQEVERLARLLSGRGVDRVRVWCTYSPARDGSPLQSIPAELVVPPGEVTDFFDEAVRNGVWKYDDLWNRAGIDALDGSFKFLLGYDTDLILETNDRRLLNETRAAWREAGYEVNETSAIRRMTIAVALLVVLGCFGMARSMFWLPPIPSHHGDGNFQNLSHYDGPIAVPGYCIKMPEFDLGNPYEAEYRLGGLTDIGRDCGIHLAIRTQNVRFWSPKDLAGKLELELIDSNGKIVVSVTGPLGDYIWEGRRDLWVLFRMGGPEDFIPNSAEEYRIRLTYEPDARLAGFKGFVYIRSGGSK